MNIAEIARLAGVSSAAVSRYFNNGCISDEKRELIRRVVEETGYRPLAQARMLRTRKTMQIGVIVPKVASRSMGKMIDGILKVLENRGYKVLLSVTGNDPGKEKAYLHDFDEGQADGIILSSVAFTGEHCELPDPVSVPMIVAGQRLAGYYCVYHDDYHAVYEAAAALITRGVKNPGYIGYAPENDPSARERLKGFQDAVRDMLSSGCPDRIITVSSDDNSGFERAEDLFVRFPESDGIICAADELTSGIWIKLKKAGLTGKVPLYGVSDTDLPDMTQEGVSLIRFNYEDAGKLAAKALLDILDNNEPVADEIRLGYNIL